MAAATVRPVALVTGASAGIGASFAERLAKDGHNLVLVARRKERLEAMARKLEQEHGAHSEILVADLTQPPGLAAVRERAHRGIELLINNAGFGAYRPFAQLQPKILDELLEIHVRVVSQLTHAALPGMIEKRKGAVINIASLLALSGSLPSGNPLPFRAVYAGAKAFTVTFTQTLAGELGDTGVKVQVCLPGIVETEFHVVQGGRVLPNGMKPGDVVQASLTALARNEVICVPGLDDPAAVERLNETQRALMGAANRPALAARYTPANHSYP